MWSGTQYLLASRAIVEDSESWANNESEGKEPECPAVCPLLRGLLSLDSGFLTQSALATVTLVPSVPTCSSALPVWSNGS